MLNTISRRSFLITSASISKGWAGDESNIVQMVKTPQNGLQPQAVVDSEGVIHLIYLHGDPSAADIAYLRKDPRDQTFSAPICVNSQPGSAIALGTVRGGQLAVSTSGRVHVAWNGSSSAEPKGPRNSAPMLYTRWNHETSRFEPQRSVMTLAGGLDGGGTLMTDGGRHVYVAWHGQGQQNGKLQEGEA